MEEQIREFSDYTLDFSKFKDSVNNDKVKEVRYYTENSELKKTIQGFGGKFKEMSL
jgi:hypothetical protein